MFSLGPSRATRIITMGATTNQFEVVLLFFFNVIDVAGLLVFVVYAKLVKLSYVVVLLCIVFWLS